MTAINTPVDYRGQSVPLVSGNPVVNPTIDSSISASTAITLNSKAKVLEVNAIGGGVYGKWKSTVTAATSDFFVQSGATRHFPIPKGAGTVNIIQKDSGAEVIVYQYK